MIETTKTTAWSVLRDRYARAGSMIAVAGLASAIMLGAGTAHATPYFTLDLSGADEGVDSIPGASDPNNDLLEGIYGAGTESRDGYYGAQVLISKPGNVKYEYLGKEAGFDNGFDVGTDGTNEFTTNSSSPGDSVMQAAVAGLLDFQFDVGGDVDPGPLVNGSNPDNSGPDIANFFVSFDGDGTATSGRSLIVFLDDAGGGDDDNHDDMAVRITAVPVPATLGLLGTGLIGLGILARRRTGV